MAESAAASNAQLLTMLAGLPKTLFGSTTNKTTSGGSLTEQTMFSKEAIDSLLRGIMEGTSGGRGFAEVAAGQKAPGLYNATSRNMLMSDYATRAAGVVAEKTAPKVSTRGGMTEATKIPGMMSKGNGLLLAAGLLGGTKTGRKYVEDLFKDIGSVFPGGSGDMSGILSFDDVAPTNFLNSAGTAPDFGASAMDSFFPGTAGAGFDTFTDTASFAGGAGDSFSTAMDFGSAGLETYSSIYDTYDAADAAQGLAFADGASAAGDGIGLTGLGSALRGDYADAATEASIAAFVPGGAFLVAADNILGTDITGQVGDKVFDDILNVTDGKVICTELCRQGLMSKHVYIAEATANLARLSTTTLAGYHYIAMPIVHRMRTSKALSEFLLPWVLAYSNEILYNTGGIRGKFVRYVLEPVCYVVGLAAGKQDYKSLYKAA
jgi:hypothetical protein